MHNGHVKKTQDKGEASEGKGNGETSPGKKRWGGEAKEIKKKKKKNGRYQETRGIKLGETPQILAGKTTKHEE